MEEDTQYEQEMYIASQKLIYQNEHHDGLEDIANCCSLNLPDVLKTYERKQSQYAKRNFEKEKNIDIVDRNKIHAVKAYIVMREYAFNKLGYTENWIE